MGSDLGGSIRVPAHFCGVYGHKPTLDLVSAAGHAPGGAPGVAGFSTLLAVAGPMARSAEDLIAAMRILGGPADYTAKAWRWELPAARHQNLKEFRVGYVLDDSYCPVTPETKAALETAVLALERAGAKLKPGWPAGIKLEELNANYQFHFQALVLSRARPKELELARREEAKSGRQAPGLASFAQWQEQNLRRLAYRARWQSYFQDTDVFFTPVAFTPAFAHDHSEPIAERTIATAAGNRPYSDELFRWIAAASITGCPAVSAPIGLGSTGMPIGMQIMGPFWEDATPLVFAKLLAAEIGGFQAPQFASARGVGEIAFRA